MGKVILGAVIGAIVVGLIGAIPDYSGFGIQSRSGLLEMAKILHAISIMIGAGAGGIVGAIAGAVAAQPQTKPLPRWVDCSSGGSVIGVGGWFPEVAVTA